MKKLIRIGNAGGYWGDDLGVLKRQILAGRLDYVTMDFLAEITMSIMQKQRQRDPQMGYAYDFITQLEDCLALAVKKGVTIITNAGGVNPIACGEKVQELAKRQGLSIKVGVVYGDDILDSLDRLIEGGEEFRNLDTGEKIQKYRSHIASANIYFGAEPVVEALRAGCHVVVTGRVTDTGLTLAPMIHEFGWSMDDWDKLASGIVAGHIIECGAQSSGGNITDWQDVPSFDNIGYPIVEVEPSGEFTVTKAPRTGGLVSEKTVKEQLIYEMGDPGAYITPEVIARFDTICAHEEKPNRVRVSGVRGEPPTGFLKVSMSYADGYKASGELLVSGPHVRAKANAFQKLFWKRVGLKFEQTRTEAIGLGCVWPAALASNGSEPNEILLRFSVRDHDEEKVKHFGMIVPSVILSGPSGVAVTGGRPKPEQVLGYWPALIRRSLATAKTLTIDSDGSRLERIIKLPLIGMPSRPSVAPPKRPRGKVSSGPKVTIRLRELAYARSGDKGDTCNIGVLARSPEIYDWLSGYLTAARVAAFFKGVTHGAVIRHTVDNLLGFNFLMERSLGGGGSRSLMIDPQGKTLAQALLEMQVVAPAALVKTVGSAHKELARHPKKR